MPFPMVDSKLLCEICKHPVAVHRPNGGGHCEEPGCKCDRAHVIVDGKLYLCSGEGSLALREIAA